MEGAEVVVAFLVCVFVYMTVDARLMLLFCWVPGHILSRFSQRKPQAPSTGFFGAVLSNYPGPVIRLRAHKTFSKWPFGEVSAVVTLLMSSVCW